MDGVEAKLKALKLKYPSTTNPNLKNSVKLYLHVSGNTPKSRWIVSNKIAAFSFIEMPQINEDNDEESEDSWWVLKVGSKLKAKVGTDLQLKSFGDQRKVEEFFFRLMLGLNELGLLIFFF
ncbi:hypothetical protein LOK49_LG14G01293 [Camellia lanceoleosa]|uniref:Uncharacterized protein n=1 Tax=Camellia lanceoleosa TaxID=1840588 RepID=A0ACC0FAY1_9ERIC|nr:hypothetical protein LOK49_LG14G01293 [Camellia lanceoleosa]